MATKLIEAGIDWMTGTSADDQGQELIKQLWNNMLDELRIGQAFRRKANWLGYAGWRVEHSFYGEREDGCCVVVSGPLAYNYGRAFLDVGARPSRLDLQVTGQPVTTAARSIESLFYQAREYRNPKHRPPALKMWVSREGPEGLYIGSRASEVMLRIYDKGRESRQAIYAGHLRVEAELKQRTALRFAGALLASEYTTEFCAGAVRGLAVGRGITIPFEVEGPEVVLHKTSYVTPVEGKMAWLRSQVSPTIQALVDEVGWASVLSVIMPDSLDKHTDTGL